MNKAGSHLEGLGGINVRHKKQNMIFDLWADDVFSDDMESYGDIEGTSWMSALAPLRTDIMSGDMRLFYLLWLAAIARGDICDTAPEPLAGLGTLTSALQAAVEFFDVDQDIVAAATQPDALLPPKTRSRDVLAFLSEEEKTNFLTRIIDGDIYAVPELRQLARRTEGSDVPKRTAGELRAQAETIRQARIARAAELRRQEDARRAAEAEEARQRHLDALRTRGEAVWDEIETHIAQRSGPAYALAADLLRDLKQLAATEDQQAHFARRLDELRRTHARKLTFLKRVADL